LASQAIARAQSRARLRIIDFARYFDGKYIVSKVHRAIADKLESIVHGKINRLIITVPPRHGKSRLVAIEFPAWLLGASPEKRITVASYGASLSSLASSRTKQRVNTSAFQCMFPNFSLNDSRQTQADWETGEHGGYRAVGIGGSLTGFGCDVLIVDDPIKDHVVASSPNARQKIWDWFTSVAMTRLTPNGVVVIIMTRWHQDDLVGRLLDPDYTEDLEESGLGAESWEVLNLPALAEANDVLGRAEGEALFPEKISREHLEGKRKVLGSYLWACMYEGRPQVKGGNYVSTASFRIIQPEHVPEGMRWMRFWDVATSEDKMSDFTSGMKGALGPETEPSRGPEQVLYLDGLTRGQWIWPKARDTIKAIAESERILVGVEAVGGFKTSVDNLREVVAKDVMILPINIATDKLTRALGWFALVENRKVCLVQGPWCVPFMAQAEAFPMGAHDDDIDAVSGLYAMLKSERRVFVA
jgi:predicted phage terminase large subunit-like protein